MHWWVDDRFLSNNRNSNPDQHCRSLLRIAAVKPWEWILCKTLHYFMFNFHFYFVASLCLSHGCVCAWKTTWLEFGKDHVLAQNSCFGCRKHGWRLSKGLLKISSGFTLTNIETQPTQSANLAAYSPATTPPSLHLPARS